MRAKRATITSKLAPPTGSDPREQTEDEPRKSKKSSCAECQRLKLKCDKNFPCASCVRRGCGSVCPTGTLRSTGRGKRSVLPEVPELTSAMAEMGDRIRQLEQAIIAAADGKYPRMLPQAIFGEPQLVAGALAQTADALGAFSVNPAGDAVYYGPHAGAETLLSIEGGSTSTSHIPERRQSSESFTSVTASFPFSHGSTSWDAEKAVDQLYLHLPPEPRGLALCKSYFQNGCWSAMPLMQDEAAELLKQFYHPQSEGSSAEFAPASIHPQRLAVMFIVFAFGALVDLTLPPDSDEADQYFELACAALSVQPIFENATVQTVQALTLLALYYTHGGRRYTTDGAWTVISLAAHIARTLGMHRESFGSKLPPKLAHRCRALFWEVYAVETICGLSLGRPTGTPLASISCPMPPDPNLDEFPQPFVKINPGYQLARWTSIKEISAPTMETFLSTPTPSYETVLDLDERIRRHLLSAPYDSYPEPEAGAPDAPAAFVQRYLVPHFCKIVVMYIHNGSFREAMRDRPSDPLASAYAASFLAMYRSSSEIIKGDIRIFTEYPALFTRYWAIWKSLFAAAMVVGTIAIRYPNSQLAPHAMVELCAAVDIIEKGAGSSGRARSGLSILQRLRDKAVAVYSQYSGYHLPPPLADPQTEEELRIFAGYTRVVANKMLRQEWPSVAHDRSPRPHRENSSPEDSGGSQTSTTESETSWHQSQGHANYSLDDVSRDFDPRIVRYFNESAARFAEGDPTAGLYGYGNGHGDHHGRGVATASVEDGGFFFTFTATTAAAAAAGGGYCAYPGVHSPSRVQETQWIEYLQSL